ncbi:hypothetical protein BT96DRAFT_230438 [Gymnopus androsaceus JB14]|uniref:DUF6699 domain-containing protein n=1 Tax=Gymnopus androsaceus JB14 TaxID=1447944 RepID=A0A6A4H602_9AGAR|nr:hypothetical protein BT96DRAFT_230438 [Gymnopus androsaceus JB14]
MPGKHVRFANISTVYPESIPPHPAPSVRTRTSSHFSSLPPSHYAYSHPQRKRSHSYPLPTRLHHLLAYSKHPVINYDVSLAPSTITTTLSGLPSTSFSEPAVHPPVSSLVIQIPYYIWPISVHASYNGQYVTVNDVFTAVYHSLRTNVSSSEYRAIPSKKEAEKVRMAYMMRYRRLHDRYAYEAEKQQGVKRVDFLNWRTRFMGLTTSEHGSDVWLLHLS